MKFSQLLIVGLLAQSAVAAEPPDPASCAELEDDQERLACFDDAFGQASAVETRESRQDTAPEATDRPRADPGAAAPAVSEFGAESVKQPIDRLEARLVGEFNGWSGNTVFRLDNGQVWRQTRNYIRDYTPPEPLQQPRVTISRGFMGSYNLKVEGIKRIVQVRRVE